MSRAAKFVTSALGNYARFTFSDLIGQEQKFLDCIKIGIKVAKTYSIVLILEESGTGKELFAQAIHNASSRKDQPFFAINCAAIPRDLLGSELFGYVEGAFTGAKKGGSPGKFELADGGTIFLDEIGEMPLDMQTSLLRVLEEKAVTRVGDKRAIPVDVRVVAATNRDLEKEVEKGNFRADLYYRINVVSIELPPLRDRTGDISLLISHFVKKISERMEKKIDIISVFSATHSWTVTMAWMACPAIIFLIFSIIMIFGPKAPELIVEEHEDVHAAKNDFKLALKEPIIYLVVVYVFLFNWLIQGINDLTPGYFAIPAPVGVGWGPMVPGN